MLSLRFAIWTWIVLMSSPAVYGQVLRSQSELTDPTMKSQVYTSRLAAVQIYQSKAGEETPQTCSLKANSKGSVVAKLGQRQLVVFDQKDWKNSCKGILPKDAAPIAWIDESELKPMGLSEEACAKMSCRLEDYGDRCSAYEYLEGEIERLSSSQGSECDKNCATPTTRENADAVIEMIQQAIDVTNFRMNNRCLVEGEKIDRQLKCDFDLMLKEARTCAVAKKASTICPPEVCRARLNKMACENSPWRGFDLDQRLHLMLESAEKYAKPFGVDPRIIPCLAGNEIGTFEPMYKNLMACDDPNLNSYHGLGMLTKTTLKDFLNPLREFKVRKKNSQGQIEEVAAPKFHSQNPHFQKKSYYACPDKLHSMMAASPDLQIELMAYTLQQKQTASKGSERQALANYNGLASLDANQKPHMENYAASAMECTQCLRENQPLEGELRKSNTKKIYKVKTPAECLSITMRSNSPSGFHMVADRKAFEDFEKFGKYCEGGR